MIIPLEGIFWLEATLMPLPHFPSDESDEENAPDLNDVVDRILNGGDDPSQPG